MNDVNVFINCFKLIHIFLYFERLVLFFSKRDINSMYKYVELVDMESYIIEG